MEDALIVMQMVLALMMISIMVLFFVAIWKIKRVLTRALTFVFTFSLKPKWKNLK